MAASASADLLAVLDLAASRERAAGQPDGAHLAARAGVLELLDHVRSTRCHCCAASPPWPAIECDRCKLLQRYGSQP